jgi:hypothetical protein
MKCQIIFLNRWIDCPNEIVQRNLRLQDAINAKRIEMLKWMEQLSRYEQVSAYNGFIRDRRKKLKLLKTV